MDGLMSRSAYWSHAAACLAAVMVQTVAGSSLDALQDERKIVACKFEHLIDWEKVPPQKAFVSLGTGYRPAAAGPFPSQSCAMRVLL